MISNSCQDSQTNTQLGAHSLFVFHTFTRGEQQLTPSTYLYVVVWAHSRLYLSAFQTLQIGHFSFTLSTRFLSSQLLFKQSQRYCCSVLLLCCFLFFEMGTYTYIWITGWTSACKLFDEMTETNLTAFESIQMHYHWAF